MAKILIPVAKWQTKNNKRFLTLEEAMVAAKVGDAITQVVIVEEVDDPREASETEGN